MDVEVWNYIAEHKLPILGICYGLQEIIYKFGGKVEATKKREYGKAYLDQLPLEGEAKKGAEALFNGVTDKTQVWMSHGDKINEIPPNYIDIGTTNNSNHACIMNLTDKIYGIQFHPEVTHTPEGKILLKNFSTGICNCKATWNMGSFHENIVKTIKEKVGDSHVIGAVSGGVDSTVAALLMNEAIGKQFHAILVDNGLLRKDEAKQVMTRLTKDGIDLRTVDKSDLFLELLKDVSDPEKKRKIIGNTFIDVFEEESKKVEESIGKKADFLLQGTLYPDVIESTSFRGPSATIKSHHNVGGLKDKMKLKLIEPLRELFKDEVRALGRELGLDEKSVSRHPFPGPGLAIRCIGDIKKEYLDIIREADDILISELHDSGDYYKIGQALCVLLPIKSVGVMGDCRTYEKAIALRIVQTTDFMTADWYRIDYDLLGKISSRILNEVHGVNRVVYDISSKPPSTIEWE